MASDGDDGVTLPPSKRVRVEGKYTPAKTEPDARCVSSLPGNARWSVAVLCDPALFRFITSFQSGFHTRLLDLERENGVTPEEKRKARKVRENMARYGLDMFRNRDYPDVSRALAMTRQADRSMTDLAIETNDLCNLEMVYELRQQEELRKHPRCRFYHAMRAAAQFGRVEMLEWRSRLKEGEEWLTDPWLLDAAFNNHMEILQFLVENALKGETKEIPDAALSAAAGNGHLEVVEYLMQVSEKPCPEALLEKAAFEGHLHVVKYVYPLVEFSSSTLVAIVEGIAANGQYDVMSYLLQQNPEIDDANGSSAIEEAADLGYLEVIQLLLDRHPEFFNTDAFSSAISNWRSGILKLLHERVEQRKSEWLEDGEDEVMEYEVEGLNNLVQLMIEVAAGNGHFEVVQWLFRHYPHSFEMEAVEHAASGATLTLFVFFSTTHRSRSRTKHSGTPSATIV